MEYQLSASGSQSGWKMIQSFEHAILIGEVAWPGLRARNQGETPNRVDAS
jgi:hypothetical protein